MNGWALLHLLALVAASRIGYEIGVRRAAIRAAAIGTNDGVRLDALDRDGGRTIRPAEFGDHAGWAWEDHFFHELRNAIDAKLVAEDVGR
ncbi:MAG TPA: hypothetical protein VFN76_09790 [Candidatus Limnocylindria bacterium]|nr:hypothetical protein [Candidatus Limnocylindria bacterium]